MRKLYAVLLIVLFLGVSCVPVNRRQVSDPGSVGGADVVVVGKIVFDPPLTKESQDFQIPNAEGLYRNKTWLVCGTKLRALDVENMTPGSSEFEGKIDTVNGETFYSACSSEAFYIIAASFYKNVYMRSCGLNCTATIYDTVLVPGSFYIDLKPDDKAVYIGTIKYHRDNFFNIVKIEIIDEYNREMPEFRHLFGPVKLRKALIRQPAKNVIPKIGSPY